MPSIKTIKRNINYFNLRFELQPGYKISHLEMIFSTIQKVGSTKSSERFVKHHDKQLYITDIKINKADRKIQGRLLNIRMDNFPELLDTSNDNIRDIEAKAEEGIIEASHFIISFKHKVNTPILAFEFNQFGPRVSDLTHYLERFMYVDGCLRNLSYFPLVKDTLVEYRARMNRVSRVIAQVHKDNVSRVQDLDTGIWTASKNALEVGNPEYVHLTFKFDYRKSANSSTIRSKIENIIDKFISDPKKYQDTFDKFEVKAEDEEQQNKLKDFDLLNNWVKSVLLVEQKPRSRVIISSDIFDKMNKALLKEFKV